MDQEHVGKGTNKVVGDIVKAFGLTYCRKFTLKITTDLFPIVEAEFYPTEEQMKNAQLILQDFELIPRKEV